MHKQNGGVLFNNERKKIDSHPDLTGKATICCTHCGKENQLEQSAWSKVSRSGEEYLSISYREKREFEDSSI